MLGFFFFLRKSCLLIWFGVIFVIFGSRAGGCGGFNTIFY